MKQLGHLEDDHEGAKRMEMLKERDDMVYFWCEDEIKSHECHTEVFLVKLAYHCWIATFLGGSFSSKSEIYIRCYTNCLTKILLDPKSNHVTWWNPLRQGSSSQWSMVPCVQLARARQRIPWVYGPWTRRRRCAQFTHEHLGRLWSFFSFWGVICCSVILVLCRYIYIYHEHKYLW